MEGNLSQKQTDIVRVVCFGPESTGKTTLCKALAEAFGTVWTPEFMRIYLEEKWQKHHQSCSWNDLLPIAYGQMALENEQVPKANRVLFCDTDLLELMTYSKIYYQGKCPAEIQRYATENHYDFYFLTDIDIPWEPDPLRDRPNDRPYMFDQFKKMLIAHKKSFITLRGDAQIRLETASEIVRKILLKQWN
ncbi:AAA family ATPase [Capnocytophaga canimorsus]|uniref:AAA family ATPase n=1 Tax=Capnocytophaga canimorsus TaxID=28188 RepID=UPI0005A53F04|nr:ATP-binding protein [Capnocytophaga canimorsus]WGU68885.1 ATP-binding protein [Capnocytophaga canimorsus]WGU70010.1 ATP-binding protein [Capnocytophaga canimorsus]